MKCEDESTGTLVALGPVESAGRKPVAAESVALWGASSLPRLTRANPAPTLPRLKNFGRVGCERSAGRVKARQQGATVAAHQGGA
jgi:hypothetical protein